MNRHIPRHDSRTQTDTTKTHDFAAPRPRARRRWVGLLALLALVTTSAVLAYPPDPWGHYWGYTWQPSSEFLFSIVDSNITSCEVYSHGSVCAEFRTLEGHVAGKCCIDANDLYSADPEKCLVGVTYQRDDFPDE